MNSVMTSVIIIVSFHNYTYQWKPKGKMGGLQ
jgi:hypothetical protein